MTVKRLRYDVDILDKRNGETRTYTVRAETPSGAILAAIREHGNNDTEWAGNVRLA
jgi:hypothetical protein